MSVCVCACAHTHKCPLAIYTLTPVHTRTSAHCARPPHLVAEVNFVRQRSAESLTKVQDDNNEVEIGSYPFFHAGKLGVSIVVRSEDQSKIDQCNLQILKFVKEKKIEIVER